MGSLYYRPIQNVFTLGWILHCILFNLETHSECLHVGVALESGLHPQTVMLTHISCDRFVRSLTCRLDFATCDTFAIGDTCIFGAGVRARRNITANDSIPAQKQ